MIVQRRSIVTVDGQLGSEQLWASRIRDVRNDSLRAVLYETGRQMISQRRKQGEEFVDRDDVHVYGPYASADRLMPMLGNEEMAVDANLREQLITERATSRLAFASYLLVANFEKKVGEESAKPVLSGANVLVIPAPRRKE